MAIRVGQSVRVRTTVQREFWRPFGAALGLYLLGRVVTTIGAFVGSRAAAIGEVAVVCAILAALAWWFPKTVAALAFVFAAGQALIWLAELPWYHGGKEFLLMVLNGAAAAAAARAFLVQRSSVAVSRKLALGAIASLLGYLAVTVLLVLIWR